LGRIRGTDGVGPICLDSVQEQIQGKSGHEEKRGNSGRAGLSRVASGRIRAVQIRADSGLKKKSEQIQGKPGRVWANRGESGQIGPNRPDSASQGYGDERMMKLASWNVSIMFNAGDPVNDPF
jgi:hypothetical protein